MTHYPPVSDLVLFKNAKVLSVSISNGESALMLSLDNGEQVFLNTNSDCCSETWFADIVGLDDLRGESVLGVERLPLPEWVNVEDGRGRQDFDDAYAYRLTTAKGDCDIIVRNSSNGYYGGDVYLHGKEEVWFETPTWRLVEGDEWSA